MSEGPPLPALKTLDRIQPILLLGSIGIGLGLARVAPGVADALLPLVSVGVFFLIYLVMLGIDFAGVTQAFANRKFIAVAVAINFVVNPLLAWGLGALFLRSEPSLWIGFILFLVTPCIGWYLVFTELAGGDTRLGVSLLGINVVLQVLLLPVYLYLFAGEAVSVEASTIIASVATFLVAPLVFAAATRRGIRRRRRNAETVEQRLPLGHVKAATLVVVVIAMFASHADELFDHPSVFVKLLVPIGAFFVIAFLLALGAGYKIGLPYDQTVLLVFTTTSRNSEASLAIAATAFTSPLVPLAVVIGPIIELPLLVVMVRVLLGLRNRPRHFGSTTILARA